MIDKFDNFIRQLIFLKTSKLDLPDETSYFRARSIGDSIKEKRDYVHGIMGVINGNTSTLLTHISTMIAVLGVMIIIFQENKYTILFIVFEIILYTFLAVLCVMNLRWRGFLSNKPRLEIDDLYHTMIRKRYLYQFCIDNVVYVTLLFILTLMCHVIWFLLML